MECPSADPSSRTEVDFMILDYIICNTISGLLYSGEVESVAWSLDTIDTFLLTLQDTELIPDDLRTKLEIFNLMRSFLSYAWPTTQVPSSVEAQPFTQHWKIHPKRGNAHRRDIPSALSEIVTQFILLCNNAPSQMYHEKQKRITARLIVQAALEEIPMLEKRSPESFDKQLLESVDSLIATLTRKPSINLAKYWPWPVGIPLASQVELSSREMPLPNLRDELVHFLSTIVEGLEAPVLVQLERGQLHGLSRTETKQLKERVGLR